MSNAIKDIAQTRANQIETVSLGIDGIPPVRIRRLKAKAMIEMAKLPDDESGLALAAASIVGDDGQPVFTVDELRELDWELCQALIEVANKFNGLEQQMEQARKNSPPEAKAQLPAN